MEQTIRDRATRSNARTAGAAAALVAVVLVVQAVLGSILSTIGNVVYSGFEPGTGVFGPLGSLVITFATSVLPAAIGVFIAFWFIVPLTPELRVLQVVVRSLVAAAAAAVVSLLFTSIFAAGGGFTAPSGVFGQAFPFPSGLDVAYAVYGTVQTVLYSFISQTPLVVLAGVLVWLWVARTRHGADTRP
jgi:hypothetical protein